VYLLVQKFFWGLYYRASVIQGRKGKGKGSVRMEGRYRKEGKMEGKEGDRERDREGDGMVMDPCPQYM
jgi:hypothetical protein